MSPRASSSVGMASRSPSTKDSTPSSSQQDERQSADAALLAALAFTPCGHSRHSFSSDDWSDPRVDTRRFTPSPLGAISPLSATWSNLWVSPLPSLNTDGLSIPHSEDLDGIDVPPLLKELLGVEFLPYSHQEVDSGNGAATASLEDEGIVVEEEPISLNLDSVRSQLSLDVALEQPTVELYEPLSNHHVGKTRRSRKLSSAIGIKAISSKVRKAGERRKQRRREKLESRDSLDRSWKSIKESAAENEDEGNRKRASTLPVDMEEAWDQSRQALQAELAEQKLHLEATQTEVQTAQLRVKALALHRAHVEKHVADLEEALAEARMSLESDTAKLIAGKEELVRLEARCRVSSRNLQETMEALEQDVSQPSESVIENDPVLNPMMATPRTSNTLTGNSPLPLPASAPPIRRTQSASFIRVHDLDMDNSLHETSSLMSDLSSHTSACCSNEPSRDIVFLDNDVKSVLDALMKFGFDIVTDESDRFVPALNTERLLSKCPPSDDSWPIRPWHPAFDKEVLVWSGKVDHDGHGCTLPVVKARGIIPTTGRNVIELILDSSRVVEYNKMSQGRTDVVYLQKGLDTTAEESEFSFAGEAKITESLSKPPMIRRTIEMLSLLYARPLEELDGLLCVSRSVWEDSSGRSESSHDRLRSEILLGVNLVRPVKGPGGVEHCELTTITHAHTTAVPEYMYKRMAPGQSAKFIRDLQALFQS